MKRTIRFNLFCLLMLAACSDNRVALPRDMGSLPFGRLRDVKLNMKRSELERTHRLSVKETYWTEIVDGYPVNYYFDNDRLQSFSTEQVDPTEPLAQERYRQWVLEAFRQTGVKPVCGYDPSNQRSAARFDLRDAVYIVAHTPEVMQGNVAVSKPVTVRWYTLNADLLWSRMQPQICVR